MAEKNYKDRSHAILSASSSSRWMSCTKSALAEYLEPNETTPFAEEGTTAHEVAERVASGEKVEPDEKITAEMIGHASNYSAYIMEHTTQDSTVMLEQRLDFSPWVPGGFGTGDCLILDDGHITVIDYKYGTGVAVSAENNSQMRLYALGAINDYGAIYSAETVTMCIYQPRINNISEETITVDELMTWAEETLKPAAKLAAEGKGDYKPGPHCKFCRHAGKCRELTKTCTEAFRINGTTHKVENLAPWEYDEILRMQPLIELWLKRVTETALQKLMAGEEIPGQKLVEGRSSRKWDNPDEVVKDLFNADIDRDQYMTAPELMSPSQLEKSIGKKKLAELVGQHITKAPGKIGLAPVEDKRPAYNPAGEFENLEE